MQYVKRASGDSDLMYPKRDTVAIVSSRKQCSDCGAQNMSACTVSLDRLEKYITD